MSIEKLSSHPEKQNLHLQILENLMIVERILGDSRMVRRLAGTTPEGLGWPRSCAAEMAMTKAGSPSWQDMLFHKGVLTPRFSLWESQGALRSFQTKALSVTEEHNLLFRTGSAGEFCSFRGSLLTVCRRQLVIKELAMA